MKQFVYLITGIYPAGMETCSHGKIISIYILIYFGIFKPSHEFKVPRFREIAIRAHAMMSWVQIPLGFSTAYDFDCFKNNTSTVENLCCCMYIVGILFVNLYKQISQSVAILYCYLINTNVDRYRLNAKSSINQYIIECTAEKWAGDAVQCKWIKKLRCLDLWSSIPHYNHCQ